MQAVNDLIIEFSHLFGNPIVGGLFAVSLFYVFNKGIPKAWNSAWDKYSKARKAEKVKEKALAAEQIKLRDETRSDIKQVKGHLIKLNGHTNDEMIHVPRVEIYGQFEIVKQQGIDILKILATKGGG